MSYVVVVGDLTEEVAVYGKFATIEAARNWRHKSGESANHYTEVLALHAKNSTSKWTASREGEAFVIAVGSFLEGFEFIGVYHSREEAEEAAEQYHEHRTIHRLQAP